VSQADRAVRIASGLHFPTSVTFDAEGLVYVAESGLPFGGAPEGGRILRVEPDGRTSCLKEGLRAPVNGICHRLGTLYIAEGGNPGRISALDLKTNAWSVILDGLPGGGDYHTNAVAFGPDGKLYFGQGSATNSGVVGADFLEMKWLRGQPPPPDIPGLDLVLTGENVESDDPRSNGTLVRTGAFQPFGTPTVPGQLIAGRLPCTSAILRSEPDGTHLELVAWGLRNPYGLTFLADGRLLAVDLGMNDRGSRPVGNAPGCIYEIRPGAWYGWPDFTAGLPVIDPSLKPTRGRAPRFLIANHDDLGPPQSPMIRFEARQAPTRLAFWPDRDEGIVALFGDKRPVTGPMGPPAGRSLVRVRFSDRSLQPVDGPPLRRPIDVAFHPRDRALYVLDFGEFEFGRTGELRAGAGTGVLWRVEDPA
jgi:glucose/arabinose dehydrogenase